MGIQGKYSFENFSTSHSSVLSGATDLRLLNKAILNISTGAEVEAGPLLDSVSPSPDHIQHMHAVSLIKGIIKRKQFNKVPRTNS